METSDTKRRLDAVLRADAQEVARRTLRHKFGRLSNRRIIATLRAALPADLQTELADGELLDMSIFPNSGRVGAHFGVVLVRDDFAQVEGLGQHLGLFGRARG